MSNLKDLNKRAEQTFDAIKQRKGWVTKTLVEAAKKDSYVDVDKLQKMLDMPTKRVEVEDYVKHYDAGFSSASVDPLSFIDSLELPANLSIAIATIITYGKKGQKKLLKDAQDWIEKEIENG